MNKQIYRIFPALILFTLFFGFQNCGGPLQSSKSNSLSSHSVNGPVSRNIPFDSTMLSAGTGYSLASASGASTAEVMAKYKYKGCMFDGLVSEPQYKYEEYLDLMGRSHCEALPRLIETWARPPDFSYIRGQINKIKMQTKKTYLFGMFIAEAVATNKVYTDNQGRAFDFNAMCRAGTQGQWGPNTCVPSVSTPEYQRYLKYIVRKAAELGVTDILFGQTGHQDPDQVLGNFVSQLRAITAEYPQPVIFGHQPNDVRSEAYHKSFDYVVAPAYVDKDTSQPCITGQLPNCQSVWDHPQLARLAHNVIIEIDWWSNPDDDSHRFSQKSPAEREAWLEAKVTSLRSRNIGFYMPYKLWLTGNKAGCYGFNEWVYVPHRDYGCPDEDFISRILMGQKMGSTPLPPPSPEPDTPIQSDAEFRKVIEDTYKLILDRSDSENAQDVAGIEYWLERFKNGLTRAQLETSLKASDEYFVRGLYKTILKRTPNLAGIKLYIDQLSNGQQSRAQVEATIRNICEKALQGECSWNQQVENDDPPPPQEPPPTMTDAQYRKIVTDAYKQILDRTDSENAQDTAGINYWVSRLKNGLSESALRNELKYSEEYYVRSLYLSILKRRGDFAGVMYYANAIKNGQRSKSQIKADLQYICAHHIGNECK